MYDLASDGVNDFFSRRVSAKRGYRRVPLIGIVDGTNRVFLVPHHPILSTDFDLYLGADLEAAAHYTLDADKGVVTFGSAYAPSTQPTADYTAIAASTLQITYFAYAGFGLMEDLAPRGFQLSSSDTVYTPALPDDTYQYVTDADVAVGDVPTDPTTGTVVFSQSRAQREFLARCIELAYIDAMGVDASLSDLDVAERVGGTRINASHRSSNIALMRKTAYQNVMRALYAALDEWYTDGRHYGSFVEPSHSDLYEQVYHWQLRDSGDGRSILFPMRLA